MKKWLIGLALTVCTLPLLLVCTIYVFIATERGTQWILLTAVEVSGQNIKLTGLSGTFLSTLNILQLEYKSCSIDASINDVQLDWQIKQLLNNTLAIQQLSINSLSIIQYPDCEQSEQKKLEIPQSIALPVNIQLNQLDINKLVFKQPNKQGHAVHNLALRFDTQDDLIRLQLTSLDYATFNIQTELSAQLVYPYSLQADVGWRYILDQQNYMGKATLAGNLETLEITHALRQPYEIDTVLTINNLLDNLHFTSHSRWQQIIAPMDEQHTITLREGDLKTRGTIRAVNYELYTIADSQQINNLSISSKGTITSQSITLAPLLLQREKMTLTATGDIDFANQLEIRLDVEGKNVNPAVLFADYPGRLQLSTQIAYKKIDRRNQLNVSIQKLHGKLRGYPLQGSGKIRSDLQKIQLERIRLLVGDNEIKADGEISETLKLNADINAPYIEQIIEQANGDLRGTIQVHGSRKFPKVDAILSSKELRYMDQVHLSQSKLEAHSDGSPDQAIQAQIESSEIAMQDQTLHDLNLNIDGTLQQHQLSTNFKSKFGELTAQAQGTWNTSAILWQGTIDKLKATNTPFGDWANKGEIPLRISPKEQAIETLCLQQAVQSICLRYHNNTSKSLDAQFENIELSYMQPYIRDHVKFDGQVNGNAKLRTNNRNQWIGELHLDTNQFTLTPTEESELEETFTFEKLEINAQLNKRSDIQLSFAGSHNSTGSAQFSISSLHTLSDAKIENGVVQLNLPDLRFLNSHLKEMVLKKGQAQLNLNLTGSLKNPQVIGRGSIDGLHFYLPEFGTEYENAHFKFAADDFDKINIEGKLAANDGTLDIQGWLSLKETEDIRYQLILRGKEFPIMDSVDIKASASPDLMIEGDTQRLAVSGTLLIPRLLVIIKELPAGVAATSEDEIIVNQQKEKTNNEKFTVTGSLGLSLGDAVHFTGYGLQTDLSGKLKITLPENQPTVGHGILAMDNARYSKFGQVLDINKGNIIFSGPLDDPSIDIQIQRSTANVTVTMSISGKVNDPHTTLSSDPPMSEANKLSYLLSGRSVNDLSSGEGTNLTNMALALGLDQTSSVVQELGTKFGLDTLSLEAGENGLQSTSLLLGKHLSPKLYVTYAKDLFSALGAIQLNYRLTDHISLEVESGERQTVDLIYSISK